MSFEKLKELVFNRAKGRCEFCKSLANISPQPFSIEHITPKSKGGETVSENLALACQGCNNHKYNKTSGVDNITGEESDLFNPRKEEWAKISTGAMMCLKYLAVQLRAELPLKN